MSSKNDSKTLENTFVLMYFEEADPGSQFEVFPATRIAHCSVENLRKGRRVNITYGKAMCQGMIVDISELPRKPSTKEIETQTEDMPASILKGLQEMKTECELMREQYEEMNSLVKEVLKNQEGSVTIESTRDTPSPSSSGSSAGEVSCKTSKSVEIGSQGTKVPRHVYDLINWSSYKAATRKLLMAVFSREELATKSLSGKPSPAFKEKELKARLNPVAISDIVQVVATKCGVAEALIRGVVTTKCADEAKLRRRRLGNR